MKITDLLHPDHLLEEIEAGYVRRRTHYNDRLVLLNYTEKAQYEKHWTDVTRQTRGLIYDERTSEVVARPFDKFFNLGEHPEGVFHGESIVRATDKMDGSLGILYHDGMGWAIATRGSFESEQAIHATEVLQARYGDWVPTPGLTYLFEIVFPANRIVLDYGNLDDLVLLGARDIETGKTFGPLFERQGLTRATYGGWPGPRTETLPVATFRDALAVGDRTNAEGLVITFISSGTMVKVKQEDYVRLHKLVTGLNERAVWEHLSIDCERGLNALLATIPDEFHAWVREVAGRLLDQHETLSGWAHAAYHEILEWLDDEHGVGGWERKHFATEARLTDHAPLLFHLLDGRDISPSIWKTLRPKGETASLMNRNEDVA